MSNILTDWKTLLGDFQSSVSKDLDEIRKHKAEIQQMKAEIFSRLNGCNVIRDEQRIVLSAPEIVIGNVDASGDLSGDGGIVIIKGSGVALDGVGEGGYILNRASVIMQKAEDPGIDGMEAVVRPRSAIVSQAKNIVLQSNDSQDCFSQVPSTNGQGIRIHSDTTMEIDASVSAEKRNQEIQKRLTDLKSKAISRNLQLTQDKLMLEAKILAIEAFDAPYQELSATDDLIRVSYNELQDIQNQVQSQLKEVYHDSVKFFRSTSELAEMNRQIDALEKEQQAIKMGDAFTKNTTKAALTVSAEHIDMLTTDGDGNFKENPEAGIRINSPRMDVTMQKADGSLAENSALNVQVEQVTVSTANPKVSEQSTDLPAGGSVNIYSKEINMLALDAELKDKKMNEKALAKEGKITLRAEKQEISATDTEGKATGAVDINAKSVELKSMDVDKDKRTDKELAKGSTMLVVAEKMYVGAKDKNNKSKQLQGVSEELGLFADKTLEAQQGDGKAVLQLAGGDAALSGSKTQVYGATTLNGKTEVKDELKAPKATIDNVEAKTSFKSSNISDGIPVPPPPSTAKLSAKLKEEELKDN